MHRALFHSTTDQAGQALCRLRGDLGEGSSTKQSACCPSASWRKLTLRSGISGDSASSRGRHHLLRSTSVFGSSADPARPQRQALQAPQKVF